MRKLLYLVLMLAVLWGGYWFVASAAVERSMIGWLEARSMQGWVVEYSDLKTRGFPSRFDTTIRDLELADPESGFAWNAPFFQLFALSYNPNHIIAVWPNSHTITTPQERITISSTNMRGSVVFQRDGALTLDHSAFEIEDFGLLSTLGWAVQLEAGTFATSNIDAAENAHAVYLSALAIKPADDVLARLDPANRLPRVIEKIVIDTIIAFDAPWDRLAIEQRRPQITSLELVQLQTQWRDLDFQATGKLTVDIQGNANGSISIRAVNWREMLQIAVNAGAVSKNISKTVENALELIAKSTGDPETLIADLTFNNGRLAFGPVPLGPAPRF